jgi:hypothetical protein
MAAAKKSTKKRAAKSAKKASPKAGTSRKKSVSAKRSTSSAAGDYVGTEIREMEAGKLRSGGSGKKVTSRKQAIAIGLSEARRAGVDVPPSPSTKKKK